MRKLTVDFIVITMSFYLGVVSSPLALIAHYTGISVSTFHAIAFGLGPVFALCMILEERCEDTSEHKLRQRPAVSEELVRSRPQRKTL